MLKDKYTSTNINLKLPKRYRMNWESILILSLDTWLIKVKGI